MTGYATLGSALALSLFVAGCGGDDQDPEAAKELYDRIQQANYRSFQRAPGYEERRPGSAVHASEVDIYVNDVVAQALEQEGLDAWPDGSLVVKDGFEDGALELVAVMEKRGGAWFWAEYFDGVAKHSGAPSICLDCHRVGSDYVRAFALP
jgi:hypothetical protein